jgi:magnesium transporter
MSEITNNNNVELSSVYTASLAESLSPSRHHADTNNNNDNSAADIPQTYEEAIIALNQARAKLKLPQYSINSSNNDNLVNSNNPSDEVNDLQYGRWSSNFFHCCSGGETNRAISFDEYLNTPVYRLLMKRLPWLVSLLLIQSFSATILHAFESLLDKKIVLAVFVPMLVGTGGNAGNQPGVMVTRALATGQLDMKKLLYKEFKTGIFTSAILCLIAFFRVLVEYPQDPTSAGVISITLFIGILISIGLGILFSAGLDRMKNCDPADGAAPMLTTISDLLGITLLCGIAVAFMGD